MNGSVSLVPTALEISLVNQPFGDELAFTLIWLHGLGDTATSWQDGVSAFASTDARCAATAPVRPVTINHGMAMNAWFDIAGLISMRRRTWPA